jgi:hypothetical protein
MLGGRGRVSSLRDESGAMPEDLGNARRCAAQAAL